MRYAIRMSEELLDVVDEQGRTIRTVKRSEVHGNPALLHKVVHVLVFSPEGALLLQKRAMTKDVAPGRWDTSVGGHVAPGEDNLTAALREMEEELGVLPASSPEYLYSYIHANPYESELVFTYSTVHAGPFRFNREEIDEIRFWTIAEIQAVLDEAALSDNFKSEFRSYLDHRRL